MRIFVGTKDHPQWRESETMLGCLDVANIFDISSNGNGTFEITEMCDGYFSATLTRDDLLTLASGIRSLCEE